MNKTTMETVRRMRQACIAAAGGRPGGFRIKRDVRESSLDSVLMFGTAKDIEAAYRTASDDVPDASRVRAYVLRRNSAYADLGAWVCACGEVVFGRFCPACGARAGWPVCGGREAVR